MLDTHAWLWWLSDDGRLGDGARRAIRTETERNALAVSAISAWEAAMLVKKGRLALALPVSELVAHCERLPILSFIPVTARIGIESVGFEHLHQDPADRMIVATARALGANLVTKDERLQTFEGVSTVW